MSTDPNDSPGLDPDAIASAAELAADAEPVTIEQLTRELDEMRDRWMRSEAEMANVRTRAKRDVDDTRQYAVQKFATDIVEAAENLRRGITSLPASEAGEPDIITSLPASEAGEPDIVTKLREGLEGVERNFVGILERHGIKRTDPTGQPYDANFHQAMSEQPSAEHEPGTVMQAWTQAWTLNGRLLKPAMVVVAKRDDQEAAA